MQLGALDVECIDDGIAAIVPDSVTPETVAGALGVLRVAVSAAVPRDDGSVWMVSARPAPAAAANALRLIDSGTFGTGHHPTTALCIEAIEEILSVEHPESVLDVGTGSGILALAALKMGVPKAVGLDIDADALKAAAQNARLNQVEDRFELILGGPDVVDGQWALVVANVLAAPLIDMAPVLVRRLTRRGRLLLSGISASLEPEVRRAYEHFGIWHVSSKTRSGWAVMTGQASW